MRLDTKKAVALAKRWLAEQLADEQVEDIGLEEVKFGDGVWEITLGFSRPWDRPRVARMLGGKAAVRERSYKVLSVSDESGDVTQMRNREAA